MLRAFLRLALVLTPLVLITGCESINPAVGCEFSYQCEAGSICRDGACVVVTLPPRDSGTEVDSGVSPRPDGGTPIDAGIDAGTVDAGVTDGGTRLTFAPGQYRRCHDDLECAVFGGNCLVELTLSRPTASGTDRVAISAIDPSFAAGEGVCTLPCTNDSRVCDSITVDSPSGASAAFTCQVVYAAASPYPATAPAFPFDSQLDTTALARGVPFASICRPPFQYSITHSENFCQPCTEDMQCGATGACFLERANASPASGSCVETCSATQPCSFGFTCGTLPGSSNTQTYCLPSAGTCGRCRDSDGDLRGVGRCGPLTQPNTAVDCDDTNPVAYFDSANPGHAFPAVCGVSDVNCNGKSDDVEQFGSSAHCGACGDVCVSRAGEIPHASKACLPRTTMSTFACVANCEPGYADCDGDVSNGCEQVLGANALYAEDSDGDGRGSMQNFRYVCSGTAPAGWVQNRLDCDDTNATIYGGNTTLAAGPELCDGRDNNCNGVADDVGFIVDEGTACTTASPGVCAAGTKKCNSVFATADGGLPSGSFSCIGRLDPAVQASVAESCDGLDNNCNGQVDDGLDYYEAQGQQNPNGTGAPAICNNPSGKGICAKGAYACTTSSSTLIDGGTRVTGSWTCAPNLPDSTDAIDDEAIDSNCDGVDGDLSAAIFVRPIAGGGTLDGKDTNPGTSQQPVATLQKAITLACGTLPCKDIYLAAKPFSSDTAIQLPTTAAAMDAGVWPVRIYGGFIAAVVCTSTACSLQWTRGTDKTTLIREAPARGSGDTPFGNSYAGIEAKTTSGPLSVLIDQVRLEVHAPDPSSLLQNGESAPAQLGFACPPRGCGKVHFRNFEVAVEPGMNGGAGTVAGATTFAGAEIHGGDGLPITSGSLPNVSGFPWMHYFTTTRADTEAQMRTEYFVGRGSNCIASEEFNLSATYNGGAPAAVRFGDQQLSGLLGNYILQGVNGDGPSGGGGGIYYVSQNIAIIPQVPYAVAQRGGNGAAGLGGRFSGTFNPRLVAGGQSWSFAPGLSALRPTTGMPGSGGGGGGGCFGAYPGWRNPYDTSGSVAPIDPFFPVIECPAGQTQTRGGGGGGGGCGGLRGGNGGNGGSALGLVLAPSSGSMTLTTSGTFQVNVGRGGNGGNGGRGGQAAPGGYGGLAFDVAYLNGGHGGDGGGGGGGAGGLGGSSFGIYSVCAAGIPPACGINVPPILIAQPGDYVTVGINGTGGAKGLGGAGGAKGPDTTHSRTDGTAPTPGQDGLVGNDGLTATNYAK